MATITYQYIPDQSVYAITSSALDCPIAIRSGIVLRVRLEILAAANKIKYDIQITGEAGTTEFLEADVFATLSDAQTEYASRLTGTGSPP